MVAEKRKKPRGTPFPKGNSANPGGRPKLPEDIKHVRELARQYTVDAVAALVGVLTSQSPGARVSAALALLDRGWGKPEQPVTGEGGGPIQARITVEYVAPETKSV